LQIIIINININIELFYCRLFYCVRSGVARIKFQNRQSWCVRKASL